MYFGKTKKFKMLNLILVKLNLHAEDLYPWKLGIGYSKFRFYCYKILPFYPLNIFWIYMESPFF